MISERDYMFQGVSELNDECVEKTTLIHLSLSRRQQQGDTKKLKLEREVGRSYCYGLYTKRHAIYVGVTEMQSRV